MKFGAKEFRLHVSVACANAWLQNAQHGGFQWTQLCCIGSFALGEADKPALPHQLKVGEPCTSSGSRPSEAKRSRADSISARTEQLQRHEERDSVVLKTASAMRRCNLREGAVMRQSRKDATKRL